ncbi:MAG: HNH endonuclease, partial [Erysipelotrichaceae bacterium]
TIEIDIQSYNDKQNVDIKGGFQTNKGASGADSTIDDLIKQTGLTSNQLDDIMKYTVKNADELLGSLKKGDLLDIIQGRNIDFIKVDISKYDEFVSKGLKPSNSPKIEKWLEKGGAIEVNSDGSLWKYTDKYKNAVYYRDDFPDFYSYKHPNVNPVSIEIARPKNNPADFKAANEAAGLGPNSNPPVFDMRNPPKGYTWHHMEDGKTMILVEENIHDTFRHKGGQSLINGKGVK